MTAQHQNEAQQEPVNSVSFLHRDYRLDFSSPKALIAQANRAIYRLPILLPLFFFFFGLATYNNVVRTHYHQTVRPDKYVLSFPTSRPIYLVSQKTVAIESQVDYELPQAVFSNPAVSPVYAFEDQVLGESVHVVSEGETLWSIAEQYYGNGELWTEIYGTNTESVGYFDDGRIGLIEPGQELRIVR